MGNPPRKKRLGEILLDAQLLTPEQLEQALLEQPLKGGRLGSLLVQKGYVKEEDLLQCLSGQLQIPWVDFRQIEVSPRALKLVPKEMALKYGVVPVRVNYDSSGRSSLILAMADPTDLKAIEAIEFQLNVTVRPVVATESSILPAIEEHYFRRGSDPAGLYRLHGWAAIECAEEFGGTLHAYCWDAPETDQPLASEDAKRVARKHPWWVYLDVTLCESCLAEGELQKADVRRSDSGLSLCSACGARGEAEADGATQRGDIQPG